ncbi:MAG: glutaredoxin [Kofleriaceae bacterium]|nr:glutaredoxin [Kofleriaceae bacterium]
MPEETPSMPKKLVRDATARLFAALNRADELGGEVRDYLQERVLVDPRYVAARRRVARLFGRAYVSKDEVVAHAAAAEDARAAAAPVAGAAPARPAGFGDPAIKAQIYGRKSCPWSGRAITVLEKHKVDFDFVDLDEPEHEDLLPALITETSQHTVPFVYLRGHFVGGFNALAEIERLGQLEFALMTAAEREALPAHQRSVVITPRPNTDDVAPAEHIADDGDA